MSIPLHYQMMQIARMLHVGMWVICLRQIECQVKDGCHMINRQSYLEDGMHNML